MRLQCVDATARAVAVQLALFGHQGSLSIR
jgi:hypothetical protein